jgi:hypothetical protein
MSGPSSSPIAVASTGSMQATSLGVEDALGAVRQQQIDDFVAAYNFARRLKTLNGLTHYEFFCKRWTIEPERFTLNPLQQMPGVNT